MAINGNLKTKKMITENTTIREFLQALGTECLRDNLSKNIWAAALFADYKPSVVRSADSFDLNTYAGKHPNWIITDMRFPNELEAVKEREGITIRVVRPMIYNPSKKIKKSDLEESINIALGKQSNHYIHPSETALDNAKFDYEIINNGTIEDLIEKVREILTKQGIL